MYLRMNKKGFAKFNHRCIGPKPRFRIRKKSCEVSGAVPNAVRSKRWKRLRPSGPLAPVELESDCESVYIAPLPVDEESDCASVSSFAPTASSASPAPADEPPPPPPLPAQVAETCPVGGGSHAIALCDSFGDQCDACVGFCGATACVCELCGGTWCQDCRPLAAVDSADCRQFSSKASSSRSGPDATRQRRRRR